ncbi:HTH domain-containing protein [Nannocystis pusilla]|uniref:HTH domain-containing protein n=1 Tax=Nannocystis pusilla TaxID=889268 RepID=A0A9X3ET75_9BACT|nr:HTH domain-containing protein [Nannocystis pusilla]
MHFSEIVKRAVDRNLLSHVGRDPVAAMQASLNAAVRGDSALLVRSKPGYFSCAPAPRRRPRPNRRRPRPLRRPLHRPLRRPSSCPSRRRRLPRRSRTMSKLCSQKLKRIRC